jgi:isocitrate dehydrogenase
VGELDNRGSHFYLALYWAQELASQADDPELGDRFKALAERLQADEEDIVEELNSVQGEAVDLGGYYLPDPERANAAMRPSERFNQALEALKEPAKLD